MPQPPVTKKPIPVRVTAWRKELTGLREFIEGLKRHRANEGSQWVQSMRRYTKLRIEDLLDNAPPSLVRTGEARKARAGS